jgi:hypothetical protein
MDTANTSGNAPAHRSQIGELGAKVPNRLHRGHFRPVR